MSERAKLIAADTGSRTAWEHDGQVHVLVGAVAWEAGRPFPTGARWESSLAHWSRFFRVVRIPAGWAWTTSIAPAASCKGEGLADARDAARFAWSEDRCTCPVCGDGMAQCGCPASRKGEES